MRCRLLMVTTMLASLGNSSMYTFAEHGVEIAFDMTMKSRIL